MWILTHVEVNETVQKQVTAFFEFSLAIIYECFKAG
jgi:hypothetical protein